MTFNLRIAELPTLTLAELSTGQPLTYTLTLYLTILLDDF